MRDRNRPENFRYGPRREGVERGFRGDDVYYGGSRSQREDWPSRAFDYGERDRREAMYEAGGHDFEERLRDAYGYDRDDGDRSWWASHSPVSGERPWYEERPARSSRPSFTGGDRGWGERRRGFAEGVKSFLGVGPRGYRRSDERILEDVSEALARHPDVDASDIEVRVKEGQVTLMGTVPNRWMRRLAEDAIEFVPGVEDIRVDLTVPRPAGESGDGARRRVQ